MKIFSDLERISNSIGNTRIKDLIKYDKLTGGGIVNNETHRLIIGIILIVISIILYTTINVWTPIKAKITSKNNDKIKISYKVKNVEYIKNIESKDNNDDEIDLYYDNTNPNYIKFYNINNKTVSIILLLIGIYFIGTYNNKNTLI
jgi:hypothetical protein